MFNIDDYAGMIEYIMQKDNILFIKENDLLNLFIHYRHQFKNIGNKDYAVIGEEIFNVLINWLISNRGTHDRLITEQHNEDKKKKKK